MACREVQQALIRTTPAIKDRRQLESIITSSLQRLFGDCQPYSYGLRVVECRPCSEQQIGDGDTYDAVIESPKLSMEHVRAACTFSSTPSFMEGDIYRLDFISYLNTKKP